MNSTRRTLNCAIAGALLHRLGHLTHRDQFGRLAIGKPPLAITTMPMVARAT